MSRPVIDPKWAGDFDCSSCRRKRLTATEFSQNQIKSKPRDQLVCKTCVSEREAKERAAAAAKAGAAAAPAAADSQSSSSSSSSPSPAAPLVCSACQQSLPPSSFNFNQLKKNEKRKCKDCVESSVASDEAAVAATSAKKLEDARERVNKAEAGGSAAEKLAASMALASLEGEMVTGLRPMKMKDAMRR